MLTRSADQSARDWYLGRLEALVGMRLHLATPDDSPQVDRSVIRLVEYGIFALYQECVNLGAAIEAKAQTDKLDHLLPFAGAFT